jgi:hypothetical protein
VTPETFLAEVAQPNTAAAINGPGDMRAVVNAILALDALAGLIHAHGKAAGRPDMAAHESDDDYREDLAKASLSYRVLRDAAASLKHGELSHPRKKRLARLLRRPEALSSAPNTIGLLQCDDEIDGDVIEIQCDVEPGFARASSVVADTFRLLKRIVEGEPPRTDEHDRGTLATGDATC